jgi:tRNA splicing endonuclease
MTIDEVIKLTGASRNTLKQHFRALVERGAMSSTGVDEGAGMILYKGHLGPDEPSLHITPLELY